MTTCGNSASFSAGPTALRCALPAEADHYPPRHDWHRSEDGACSWGDPPERVRYRCWRGLCLGRSRRFHRLPITNKWGWSWQYEGVCGHRRDR